MIKSNGYFNSLVPTTGDGINGVGRDLHQNIIKEKVQQTCT